MKERVDGLVSIVIPVYNAEAHLAEALDRLARQTYNDIEVLLVDDGSKDGSRAICEGYAARDGRFRYVWQENAGAGAARNHGMDLARGEYLMFVDADDLFEPELVACLKGAIERGGSDVAVCRADWFKGEYEPGDGWLLNGNSPITEGTFCPAELAGRFYQIVTSCPWDKIYRASHIYEENLKYQNLRYSNDSFFVLMALLTAKCITWIEDVLVHYRIGQGGSLRDKMYLNPLCDLEMFDALRAAVAKSDMAHEPGLMESLDTFTIDLLFVNYATLASQSVEACGEFHERLTGFCFPEWERLAGSKPQCVSVKSKIRLWALRAVRPEAMVWAVRPFGKNGMRTAGPKQWHALYARLLPSGLFGRLSGKKGEAADGE